MTPFHFNRNDTAKMFGVSVQALDKWDVEPTDKKGRQVFYYLPDVIAWRLNRDTKENLDLTAERARLAKEQADKTELENKERRGLIADVSLIAQRWAAVGANIKSRMLAIPTKAAPILAGEKDKAIVQDKLQKLIHEALTELSGNPPGLSAGVGATRSTKATATVHGQSVGGH